MKVAPGSKQEELERFFLPVSVVFVSALTLNQLCALFHEMEIVPFLPFGHVDVPL